MLMLSLMKMITLRFKYPNSSKRNNNMFDIAVGQQLLRLQEIEKLIKMKKLQNEIDTSRSLKSHRSRSNVSPLSNEQE